MESWTNEYKPDKEESNVKRVIVDKELKIIRSLIVRRGDQK